MAGTMRSALLRRPTQPCFHLHQSRLRRPKRVTTVKETDRKGKLPPRAPEEMRLNRFLARAGVASRRKSDDLIRAGSVRVNDQVVDLPGSSVRLGQDTVQVDGREVGLPDSFQYVLLYKRVGTLVTRSDDRGRTTVFDGVDNLRPATVAVGRLDMNTTGVLLLTDDGEVAHRLMHPSFEVEKIYQAMVVGIPDETELERLRRGILLEDGPTAPARVRLIQSEDRRHGTASRLEIGLHEGRKRQVRLMCAAVGHPVKRLERVVFAGLTTDGLALGEYRQLAPEEVTGLLSLVGVERS